MVFARKDFRSGLEDIAESSVNKKPRTIVGLNTRLSLSGQGLLFSNNPVGHPMSIKHFWYPQYLYLLLELLLCILAAIHYRILGFFFYIIEFFRNHCYAFSFLN